MWRAEKSNNSLAVSLRAHLHAQKYTSMGNFVEGRERGGVVGGGGGEMSNNDVGVLNMGGSLIGSLL